jgi:hypothetical protein
MSALLAFGKLPSPTPVCRCGNDHQEGEFGFMQHVYPVFRAQMLRIGVGVFRNPKALRAYGLDGPSADYNGISSSSQQSMMKWSAGSDPLMVAPLA